jgi:hypothetical protein
MHQILHAKVCATPPDADVGISRNEVRPADGHGAQRADRVLERDPILAPELFGDYEPERLTSEGMKWVRDPNLRWIRGTACS